MKAPAESSGWSFRRTLVFWWILFLVIQQAERLFLLPETLSIEVPAAGVLAKTLLTGLRADLITSTLGAVIAESHAVVSLSTGPMHLASALGVPTVSLFDPRRQQSPTRWKPFGTGAVLIPDVPTCEKCIYEACPYWDCLDRITVQTVEERITQVLARALPIQVVHV